MRNLYSSLSEQESEYEDKCGVNISEANAYMTYINSETSAVNNNPDKMYSLLMSENFHNHVNKLAKIVSGIKLDTLRCLTNNDRNKLCQQYDNFDKQNSLVNLERILSIMNRYNSVLSQIATWVYTTTKDIYKYCGHDDLKIQRVQQIISRLSVLMGDQAELHKLLSGDISINPPLLHLQSEEEQLAEMENQEQTLPMPTFVEHSQCPPQPNTTNMVSSDWMWATIALIILIVIVIIFGSSIYYTSE